MSLRMSQRTGSNLLFFSERLSLAYITNPRAPVEETTGLHRVDNKKEIPEEIIAGLEQVKPEIGWQKKGKLCHRKRRARAPTRVQGLLVTVKLGLSIWTVNSTTSSKGLLNSTVPPGELLFIAVIKFSLSCSCCVCNY